MTAKKSKPVMVSHAVHMVALEERLRYKTLASALEKQVEELNNELGPATRLLAVREQQLQLHQRTISTLERDLERERSRFYRCLEVAEEASSAAGAISRVTLRLGNTLDEFEARCRREDKAEEKRGR